jgi:K+ transporter
MTLLRSRIQKYPEGMELMSNAHIDHTAVFLTALERSCHFTASHGLTARVVHHGSSWFIQEAAKHSPGKCRHVLLQQRECSAIP